MEIKIQIKKHNYSITIGHKTKWFEQIYFIILSEEYYNEQKEIDFAKILFKI